MDKSQNGRPSIPPQRGVFDVMRPGRTPASPTSRPVVNSQKPVQDTSVTVGASSAPRLNVSPPAPARIQTDVPTPQPTPSQPGSSSYATPPAPQPRPAQQPPLSVRQEVGEAAVVGQVAAPEGVVQESHHEHPAHAQHHSVLSEVLAIVAIVLLIAVILNILVDADVLDLPIPHTNFFDY